MPAISPRLWNAMDRRSWRQAVWLGVLMAAAGLTEGIGLILLVPMLGALGANGATGLPAWLSELLPRGIVPLLSLFVALVVLRTVLAGARSLAQLRFEVTLVDGLRNRAWSALLHCDWRVLAPMSRSEGTAVLVGEIDRIGQGVNQLLAAMTQAATLAALGLSALPISPAISLIALVGASVALLLQRRLRARAQRLGEQFSLAYGAFLRSYFEGFAALRLIKASGRETTTSADTARALATMRDAQFAYTRDLATSRILLHGAAALLLALVTWLAVSRWQAGPATIVPLAALFARALPLLGALQEAWHGWVHARAPIAATMALIARAEAAREQDADGTAAPDLHSAIRLADVSLRYGEGEGAALSGVSATIPARGLVALTGPSGAGKSTFADLVGGLLEADGGTVAIDGAILAGPARRAWRARVAYVQQDPVLLAGTIRENLLWAAPEASAAQLEAALDQAAAGFVRLLPAGLDTRVGDGGRQLSGGERQRLMLARALLRDPALLILDEATSALDADNEARIAEALVGLKQRMAILVIAHRGALTALADHEIRLEQGRIVATR